MKTKRIVASLLHLVPLCEVSASPFHGTSSLGTDIQPTVLHKIFGSAVDLRESVAEIDRQASFGRLGSRRRTACIPNTVQI